MALSALPDSAPAHPHIDKHGTKRRAGEFIPGMPERSQRMVPEDGEWYYRTRERELVGPYSTRENADKAARTYTRFCRKLNSEHLRTLINQHLENLRLQTEQESAQPLREGEMEVPESRRPRITTQDGHWFFQTREGELVGPYDARETAEEASNTFLQFVQKVDKKRIHQLIAAMNAEAADA